MRTTLEIVMNVSSTFWLVTIIFHILFIEYFHRVRKEMITMDSAGWRGLVPSVLIIVAILSASTTATARLISFFI